ncbi:ABC transporter substrate-binding protein [Paucibacter sp. O1-1]|uniref:MlaC/ttg2D family ABC transporter substrate-binding protein n=1 Tax=Paucibacter sp. M5-1 TaxID=3015998 RepID=UPI0010F7990E|nr:ABC transporter substrate-binding protein [Paucibacter sp. M5-1]MCU7373543.1 ABC transporter substrate-binding protein [Paucibacter sp. O1-1]MCZ7879835.1 ABC transporter substrate-binding protein [Paucibacter sp. M5-1]MDA3828543.1 ABC transporter substrate-binding protein [Paucibacter sp. O1-1]
MNANKRGLMRTLLALGFAAVSALPLAARAADASAADTLIRQLSLETIEAVKADKAIQAGDVQKIIALVDAKVMPHINFQRMTASAVGRFWRQATPEQQKRLQDEFKILLVRTYAGALTQVKDQTIALRPLRASPDDTEVVVRTEVRGRGDPIQLDYRLEKAGNVWRIYDVNVLGIWLADQYRNSFAQEIGANGIDGLIKTLAERNQKAAAAPAAKS